MAPSLQITVGQCSRAGCKQINQDFHGVMIPPEPECTSRGIVAAVADGISSSPVSQEASEASVSGFISDYYSTPEAWSVKHSAQRVLMATNAWLHAQTQRSQYRDNVNRGYVCTLSALVLKGATAHLFHVGDACIFRMTDNELEPLTRQHRLSISRAEQYLSRALGMDATVEIDYRNLPVERGDLFVIATDGVHEYLPARTMRYILKTQGEDLDAAAEAIVDEALAAGSRDNLTVQILRLDRVPMAAPDALRGELADLPFPPSFRAGMRFDGYRISRCIHASARSHVYLAIEETTDTPVAIKTLSTELREDPLQVDRFLTEEWIARRVHHDNVVRAWPGNRQRHYLYTVMEYIEGQTLTQWMIDNPRPELEQVRAIVEQIARGLSAFHRLEILHQDLRPENLIIDAGGTVKLIDFGSARVPGIAERYRHADNAGVPGTVQYSAPEYLLGGRGSEVSDLFSLGVITYQMLTGHLPYGTDMAKVRTRSALNRLNYRPALRYNRSLPWWLDGVLKKAVHPDPDRRQQALSEFIHDLRHPGREFMERGRPPLVERDPVRFWQAVAAILGLVVVALALGY